MICTHICTYEIITFYIYIYTYILFTKEVLRIVRCFDVCEAKCQLYKNKNYVQEETIISISIVNCVQTVFVNIL